jgi:hypothetical protein
MNQLDTSDKKIEVVALPKKNKGPKRKMLACRQCGDTAVRWVKDFETGFWKLYSHERPHSCLGSRS